MKEVIRSHNDGYRFIDRACTKIGQHFDKPHLIEIKPYKPPRSLPQNAKLHSMIRDLAEHTGYSEAEMKDVIKAEFMPVKAVEIGQRILDIPLSTTELTRELMSELIEHVYQLGAEANCVFKDP